MQNRLTKKQILLICLAALIFIGAAVASDMIIKAERSKTADAVPASSSVATASSSSAVYSDIRSRLTDKLEDTGYEPGPSVLNLAYYYPEGADTGDVINSYAGQIFSHMSELEADYMSGFYALYDRSPLSVASEQGLGTDRVMGKYDPTDPAHVATDPSTWTVNHFKNINVAFYDGDGNRINQYSAVKEIISMASVYSYYHDMMDAEAMEDYAAALWSSLHSSSITLGNVYYCSGCIGRSVQDEANEAIEQEREQQKLWDTLAEATAKSAGDAALTALGFGGDQKSAAGSGASGELYASNVSSGDSSASGDMGSDTSMTGTGVSDAGSQAVTMPSGLEGISDIVSKLTGSSQSADSTADASVQPSGGNAGALGTENTVSDTTVSDTAAIEASAAEGLGTDATVDETSAITGSVTETSMADSSASIDPAAASSDVQGSGQSNAESMDQYSEDEYIISGDHVFKRSSGIGFEDHSDVSYSSQAASMEQSAEAQLPADQALAGYDASGSDAPLPPTEIQQPVESAPSQVTTAAAVSESASTDGAQAAGTTTADTSGADATAQSSSSQGGIVGSCPGHIDIYIRIDLKGIDDENGLIAADRIGNDPANFNDRWQGWTEERIAEAKELNSQDWFSRYGLTISAINLAQPLSIDEVNYYMSLLDAEVSYQRRDIIEYALNSVGRVPYYWGGKPYGGGYGSNSFGTVTWPDEKGRVLRGLDCSGWINWIYWSVTGSSLHGESTGTLVGCGRRIQRSELQPGDIIIRTGADAHVVMFLDWTQNGNMLVIHETGSLINNVVVSEMTADWPYYRSLIND